MKVIISLLLGFALSQASYGLDPKKCFKVTHGKGLLMKYDFPGYSSSEYMTKKYGTTYGVMQYSIQSSFASIDPSVTTGRMTSSTQLTSTDGGCSFYSQLREQRKEYIARNEQSILQEVAMGEGEHIKALYHLSACRDGGFSAFKAQLQNEYPVLQGLGNTEAMIYQIDYLIDADRELNTLCKII